MRLLSLLVLRTARERPLRFLLSAAGIILGVAGMLAIGITNRTALDALTSVFENTSGRTDLSVTVGNTASGGMDNGVLNVARSDPHVRAALPVLRVSTMLAGSEAPDQLALGLFGASAGGFLIQGIDPSLDPLARDYVVTQGRFLKPDQDAAEIVLVDSYAEDQELRLGQWVGVLTPGGVERLRLVGLIAREGPGLTNSGAFGVMPIRAAQERFDRADEVDQIDLLLTEEAASSQSIEETRLVLQKRLGADVAVVYPAGQGQRMGQMLGSYQIGLNFMSGIALFVGAFLIYNAFAMNVIERTREFGMLRTIGMTRGQIIGQVLAEAAFLGCVGSGLGALLGIGLATGLTRLMAVVLNQELGAIQVPPGDLGVSLTVGILTTFAAALVPALQAGRISPVEALRARGQVREAWLIRHGWIPGLGMAAFGLLILIANPFPYDTQYRLGSMAVFVLFLGLTLLIPASVSGWERLTRSLVRVIYGSTGQLGSRNIRRSRQRTTLTVAAMMIGVSMVIVTAGMTEAFSVDLKEWITSFLGGDLYVSSAVPLRPEVRRKLETVSGVAAVAPMRQFEVDWVLNPEQNEVVGFMAFDPGSYTQVTQFTFSDSTIDQAGAVRELANGGAIFLSSVLAERFQVRQGDTVYLKTRSGVRPFRVAAEIVDFTNQGEVIHGSWIDMKRYFHIDDATTFLVKTTPGADIEAVKQQIDDLYGKRYQLILESNASIRDRVLKLMDQAFAMFDVLALISIVVASLGVINTLTMNVIERTREIGMLRAIGMLRGQVVGMILAEAAVLGLIGGILGLAAGVIQTRVFLTAMVKMSGYQLEFALPLDSIITALVIAVLVSQAAAVLPARRATRTRILDAIHYE